MERKVLKAASGKRQIIHRWIKRMDAGFHQEARAPEGNALGAGDNPESQSGEGPSKERAK